MAVGTVENLKFMVQVTFICGESVHDDIRKLKKNTL
jgi:hypothetical protein